MAEPESQTESFTQATPQKTKISNYFLWWANTTGRFAFFLVFVTFLLFIATVGLYFATRDLVADARHNAHRQLRAYVSVKPRVSGVSGFASDSVAETEVIIKNSGQTPALKLRQNGILFSRHYPLTKDTDLVVPPPTAGESVITLHPGESEYGVKFERKIDQPVYQAIKNGVGRLYVFGKVQYEDVFGASHWTQFCYYFEGAGPNLPNWYSCPRNNDTDDSE